MNISVSGVGNDTASSPAEYEEILRLLREIRILIENLGGTEPLYS